MVIGSLNIQQKATNYTEWKLNWATKLRVWKDYYFCNWLRKNWQTLTSSPHWTTTKYQTPLFLFPLLEFQEKFPPINMSCLKSWSPPLLQREGGGNYGVKFPIDITMIGGEKYELKGVTYHSGSPMSGHYTAAVKFKERCGIVMMQP